MTNEIYLSVAQAADLLGISQETLYKEIQSKNLTAIENPDKKRKHQVIAHNELSRLLRQHLHPRRLPRILRRQIRRLRENCTPAREPAAPQGIRRHPAPASKTSMTSSKPPLKTTKHSSRPTPTLTKTIDNLTAVLDKMT